MSLRSPRPAERFWFSEPGRGDARLLLVHARTRFGVVVEVWGTYTANANNLPFLQTCYGGSNEAETICRYLKLRHDRRITLPMKEWDRLRTVGLLTSFNENAAP